MQLLSCCQIGEATAAVGDPSGKSKERPAQDRGQLSTNSMAIKDTMQRILENHQKYFSDDGAGLHSVR